MGFFFKRKKEEKHDEVEEPNQARIREILANERALKGNEYEGGRIHLTENYLLWEKKNDKSNSAIIPRESILKIKQAQKFRKGFGLEVTYGKDRKTQFLPFLTRALVKKHMHTDHVHEVNSWIATLETGIPSTVFVNIDFKGGHSSYKEIKDLRGKLIINSTTLVFQDVSSGKNPIKLEIPLEKIENISMIRGRKVPKLLWPLVPGLALLLNDPKNYLFVEYKDEQNLKQTPLFDFSPPAYHPTLNQI